MGRNPRHVDPGCDPLPEDPPSISIATKPLKLFLPSSVSLLASTVARSENSSANRSRSGSASVNAGSHKNMNNINNMNINNLSSINNSIDDIVNAPSSTPAIAIDTSVLAAKQPNPIPAAFNKSTPNSANNSHSSPHSLNVQIAPAATPPIQPPTLEELVANCFLYANDYEFECPMQVEYIKTFQLLISKYHAEENLNFLTEIYKYEYLYLNFIEQETPSNFVEQDECQPHSTELVPDSSSKNNSESGANGLSVPSRPPVLNTLSSSAISLLVKKSKAPNVCPPISRTSSRKLDIFPFSDEESLVNIETTQNASQDPNHPAVTPSEALTSVWENFRTAELDTADSSEQASQVSKSIHGPESVAAVELPQTEHHDDDDAVDLVDTASIKSSASSSNKGTKCFSFDKPSVVLQWNFIINSFISPYSSQQVNLLQKVSDSLLGLNRTCVHEPLLLLDAKKEIMRLIKENIYIKFIRTLRNEYNLKVASPVVMTPTARSPLFFGVGTTTEKEANQAGSLNSGLETSHINPGSVTSTPLQLPAGVVAPSIHNSMASYAIHNSSNMHYNGSMSTTPANQEKVIMNIAISEASQNNSLSTNSDTSFPSVSAKYASPSPISPAASNANNRLINSPDPALLTLPGDSPISLTPVVSRDNFQAVPMTHSNSYRRSQTPNSVATTRTSTNSSGSQLAAIGGQSQSPVSSPINLKRLASGRKMKKFIPGLHQSSSGSTGTNNSTASSSTATSISLMTGETASTKTSSNPTPGVGHSSSLKVSTATHKRGTSSSTPIQQMTPNTAKESGGSFSSILNHLRLATSTPPSPSPIQHQHQSAAQRSRGNTLETETPTHQQNTTGTNKGFGISDLAMHQAAQPKLPATTGTRSMAPMSPQSPSTPSGPSDHSGLFLSSVGIKHLFRKREKQ